MVTTLRGSVADYFSVENHMASTRSADLYRALDRSQGSSVNLWVLKHPLALNSEALERFDSRMKTLASGGTGIVAPLRYGVDSEGKAFASLGQLGGQFINQMVENEVEGERRFIKVVKLVAKIHALGVSCGDLCAASFWSDRSGEALFIGLMGSFDAEASETAVMPPVETLLYLSPEQREGGGIVPASDVFSLGVLGYHLLTRTMPYGDSLASRVDGDSYAAIPAPSSVMRTVPSWADEVLLRSLHPSPDRRYSNAQAMLTAMQESRDRKQFEASAPMRLNEEPQRQVISRPSEGKVQVGPVAAYHVKRETLRAPDAPNDTFRQKALILGAVVGGVTIFSLGLLLMFAPKKGSTVPSHDPATQQPSRPGERFSEEQLALRESEFKDLVLSDDPEAHQKLVTAALQAANATARAIPERHLVDRGRRLGLKRTADQVRGWLKTAKGDQPPEIYESMVKILDGGLPLEARSRALQEIYVTNPPLGLRLAAASALDAPKLDDFAPMLVPLFGDHLELKDAKSHSPLALLFASQDTSLTFGEDLVQRREQLGNEDVIWLLERFISRGDPQLPAIAQLAIERSLLGPLKLEILTLLRDRRDLPPTIVTALAHALADRVSPDDLRELGKWYDLDAERVLLVLCGEVSDPAMLTETFELLAGKSISREPVASLMAWIRSSHWDQRLSFAKSIGVIGNAEKFSPEEVEKALEPFGKYMKEPKLLDAFLKTEDGWLARHLIETHADDLSLFKLLPLLENKDPQVRIAAVTALRRFNDITALKFIIERYEREKDPEVKKTYEDKISFIRDRRR